MAMIMAIVIMMMAIHMSITTMCTVETTYFEAVTIQCNHNGTNTTYHNDAACDGSNNYVVSIMITFQIILIAKIHQFLSLPGTEKC